MKIATIIIVKFIVQITHQLYILYVTYHTTYYTHIQLSIYQ